MDAIFRSIAASQEELRRECQRDYVTKAAFDEHNRLNVADFDQLNRRIDGLQDEIQKQIDQIKKDHLKLFGSVQIVQDEIHETKKTT